MSIIARFAHLLRTDAVYGYIDLVRSVQPPPAEEIRVPEAAPPRRDPDPVSRTCTHCGTAITAPPSRIAHVHGMHTQRCAVAGPESRRLYIGRGRWPKRRRAA